MSSALAEIQDLHGYFETIAGRVHAINGVSLRIEEGRVTGLVGETGSGKTVTALTIPRLLPPNFKFLSGRVFYRGEDLALLSEDDLNEHFRGAKVSVAFQDPKAALNPVFTVGEQLTRVLRRRSAVSKSEARRGVLEMLERVQIEDPGRTINQYAHQLSGGMAQRVMIALAVIHPPELLILDEPTTGLDVTVQAEIISLVRGLVNELGLTVLLITHDLGVVGELCDKVSVMYGGRVMETGHIQQVFEQSCNPYTRELLRATESVEGRVGDLYSIPGAPPDLRSIPGGCLFASRCPTAVDACVEVEPSVIEVAPGQESKCHFAAQFVASGTPRREEGVMR